MVFRRKPRLLVAALIAATAIGGLGACGDAPPASDAGALDGAADSGVDGSSGVAPPEIPWLAEGAPPLMIAPCPPGWREVTVDGVVECDPYPEGGRATCDPGEAHFPGEAGCRPIGEPCPAGDYADSVPTDGAVVYVKAGATAGGAGSLAAPYATLGEVNWPSLAAGTTVALAKGTYPGALPVNAGVQVLGACVAETILSGVADAAVASVIASVTHGDAAVVRNVTVRDAPQFGALVRQGRALTLEGVAFVRVTGVGVGGGDAETAITLHDALIHDTQPQAGTGELGRGMHVQSGARIDAARVLVTENRDVGIHVGEVGSSIALRDVTVADTRSRASDGTFGRGIAVQTGAHLDAQRTLVTDNRDVGIYTGGEGSEVRLTDVIVRNTQPRERDRRRGRGVGVEGGARVEAERLVIADNREIGLFVAGAGGAATFTGAVVRGTESQESDGSGGRGISIQDGATFEAARLVVSGNREISLYVGGVDSTATVEDALVRDTRPDAGDDSTGRGIDVERGGQLAAARLLVVANHDMGIFATGDGSAITAADVVVRDTLPLASDGAFGRAINVQFATRFEGTRVRVEDAWEVGIFAYGGAEVVMRDTSVTMVRRSSCAETTCPVRSYGFGAATIGATVALTDFEIRDAEICGVFVSPAEGLTTEAALDLQSGLVSKSAIGACLQVDGYDVSRLSNDVEYRDNGTNLDTTTLPVPSTGEPIEPDEP